MNANDKDKPLNFHQTISKSLHGCVSSKELVLAKPITPLIATREREIKHGTIANNLSFLTTTVYNFKNLNKHAAPIFPVFLFECKENFRSLSAHTILEDKVSIHIDKLEAAYASIQAISPSVQKCLMEEIQDIDTSVSFDTNPNLLEEINIMLFNIYYNLSDTINEENIMMFMLLLDSIPENILSPETNNAIKVLKSFLSSILFVYYYVNQFDQHK